MLLLRGLGLLHGHSHALGDRLREVVAAHEQDADEARDPGLMHGDVGDGGAHVHERLSRRTEAHLVGPGQRAQQREAVEVDAGRGQPRPLDGGDVAGDHVPAGRHEQHAQAPGAVLGNHLFQGVRIQDRLLDWHRDDVLHLQRQRLPQFRQRRVGEIHLAHDDLAVRHPGEDLLAGEPGL